jgi:hypothetical protein
MYIYICIYIYVYIYMYIYIYINIFISTCDIPTHIYKTSYQGGGLGISKEVGSHDTMLVPLRPHLKYAFG